MHQTAENVHIDRAECMALYARYRSRRCFMKCRMAYPVRSHSCNLLLIVLLFHTVDYDAILRRLDGDLEEARERRNLASERYFAAIRSIPGQGHDGHTEHIQQASKEYREALNAVIDLIKRRQEFFKEAAREKSTTSKPEG